VTTVVRVGQSLQLIVVAEGVEIEGQRNLLSELGCDVIQGFLYAPALSPSAFGRWLLDHSAKPGERHAAKRRPFDLGAAIRRRSGAQAAGSISGDVVFGSKT
jgi:predicted signal transduction protein with EAL and GGDEF domain